MDSFERDKKRSRLVVGITAPQSVVLLKGQLKYLSDSGYRVFLLAPEDKRTIDFCRDENATLCPVAIKRDIDLLHDIRSFFQIIRIFRRINPDIVNLGTPKVSLLGMIAAKLLGVQLRIYTCRGFRFEHEKGKFRRLLIAMEKMTARYSHRVIAVSHSVRELGIGQRIFPPEKVVVLGKGSSNGIDLDLFSMKHVAEDEQRELIRKYALENTFVFGYVGRIIERKGFRELITAFINIYEKDDTTRLLVVGEASHSQISKEILMKARNHPAIITTGPVKFRDIPKHLSIMHVLVHPAYWEGFGNVLIQAAAMELPVISTDVTGCRDPVSNGFNGELIKVRDVDSLTDAMERFRSDHGLRETYGRNGPLWAENFRSELIWERMVALYRNSL